MHTLIQQKLWWLLLISDKVNFRMNYQEQRKTLHNDKKNQEDKANPECVYAKQ